MEKIFVAWKSVLSLMNADFPQYVWTPCLLQSKPFSSTEDQSAVQDKKKKKHGKKACKKFRV